jgi:hypothetical protein
MKTRKKMILLAVLTSLMATLFALPSQAVEQEGGVRFMVGLPRGEFEDTLDDESYGLEANYGLRPIPGWSFGVGGNIMTYGSEERKYSHPLVEDYNIETDNNMAGMYLYSQFRPLQGPVQPYVEGRVGMRYLWTESKITDEDWWDWDEVGRQTNYDDWASFYGGSTGLLIQLRDSDMGRNKPGVFLDAKVSWVQGNEATYLAEGDVDIVNDRPVFTPRTSKTSMTTYQLGVTLTF